MQPPHNVSAIQLGTGEFAFSLGATSRADAKLKGFRDFDNVVAFKLEATNERFEHLGNYRGLQIVDEVYNIKQGLEYLVRCDAFTRENLNLLFMGTTGTNHTQPALTVTKSDVMAFTSENPADPTKWYDIYVNGQHVRSLTSAFISSDASVRSGLVGDDSPNTFTDIAHGLEDNDLVFLTAIAGVTEDIELFRNYYVINKTDDTFQLSLTEGGEAIAATVEVAGTFSWLSADEGTHTSATAFDLDEVLGRIRFHEDTIIGDIYVYLTAPEITSSSSTYMSGIKPLENASFTGYGRLTTFQNKTRLPLYDHQDFSCTLSVDTVTESDGKTPVTFEVHVKVTTDHGNLLINAAAAAAG